MTIVIGKHTDFGFDFMVRAAGCSLGSCRRFGFDFMVRAAGCSLGSCRRRTIVGAYFGLHCSSFTEELERSLGRSSDSLARMNPRRR